MQNNPQVDGTYSIALDGPSGAGKSSIARTVAKDLQIVYVDTGAMYRAIGLYVYRQGKDTKNPKDVIPQLGKIHLKTTINQDMEQRIFLNDEDVSEAIREKEIAMAASNVSTIPEVRAFLLQVQRDMAKSTSLIMDGRDIGTVVLPNAEVKIFLTASPEARAKRRCLEYQQKGIAAEYEEVLADVLQRDHQDTTRATAPLRQADDAVLLDTTDLDFQQSVEAVKKIIEERLEYVV